MTWGSVARGLYRLLWILLVALLVVAALVASLGRYYLQSVEHYRAEIVSELNRRSGLNFSIDRLDGDWSGLTPSLRVSGLTLTHPEDPGEIVLQARQATLELDLLASLWEAAPRVRRFDADGMHLRLEEGAPGRWYLRGFGRIGHGDTRAAAAVLLALQRAQLRDVELELELAAGLVTEVHSDRLRLIRSGDFRRFQGGLTFHPDDPPLELLVEARGDPREPDGFSAQGYARFVGVDLQSVLPLAQRFGVTLREGRVNGELWLAWRGVEEFTAQGQLSVPVVDLAGLSGRALTPLEQLAMRFQLRARERDWQLWVPSLAARWGEHDLRLDQLWLQRARNGRIEAAVPRLELASTVAALRASGLLEAPWGEVLGDLDPRGELARLRLQWPPQGAATLRTEFRALALSPWQGAPGVTGADGYLEASAGAGLVRLADTDLALSFPLVYDHDTDFEELRGAVSWRLRDERLGVRAELLEGRVPAGPFKGFLDLDLPLQPGAEQPPEMTLAVGLRDSRAHYRTHFLPRFLDPGLSGWLRDAVGAGRLPVSGLIYRGSLRPEDKQGRTVQLLFEVRDAELDYHPPWPPLRAIDGQVLIDDGATRIRVTGARALAQTQLDRVELQLVPEQGRLRGNARVRTGDGDLLDLLTDTPLRAHGGEALRHWRWQGPARADLTLDLPLRADAGEPVVAVDGALGPGRLVLGDLNLAVEQLQGPLRYSGATGLNSTGLDGSLFGESLTAKLWHSDKGQRVQVKTRIAVEDLRNWLGAPASLSGIATGESPVTVMLQLREGDSQLEVQSDLQGVGIDLPPPLGKETAQSTPLRLQVSLAEEGRPLRGSWGDRLRVHWRSAGSAAASGGAVAVGDVVLPTLQPGVVRAAAQLQRVEFTDWRDVLGRMEPLAGAGDDGLALEVTELTIAEFGLLGQSLRDLRVSGGRDADGWRLRLDAEQLAGTLAAPAPSGAPLALWLSQLQLSSEYGGAAVASLDPVAVPEMEVAVGSLSLDGAFLGGVRFDLEPLPDGLRLSRLGGSLRGISFSGSPGQTGASLQWQRTGSGFETRFRGRLLSGDLAAILAEFGYERALTSRRAWMDAQLRWPGRPDEVALSGLTGEAALRIEDGRFIKVSEPTSGALKALGIFNFANLTRRLRLDFSDIFSSGVSFDRVDTRFALDQGRLRTLDPLSIRSPSSRFRADGSIDFNSGDVNMDLVATLPIASNLPWLAALAGGLPAAAGVYIVSQLFEEQVNRYSSAVYRIDGQWTDPKIDFVRIFDDGVTVDPDLKEQRDGDASGSTADGLGQGPGSQSESGGDAD